MRMVLSKEDALDGEVLFATIMALKCIPGAFIGNVLLVGVKVLRRGCGFALIGKVLTVAVHALRRGCGLALYAAPVRFRARSTQFGAGARAWACYELVFFGGLGTQTPLAE